MLRGCYEETVPVEFFKFFFRLDTPAVSSCELHGMELSPHDFIRVSGDQCILYLLKTCSLDGALIALEIFRGWLVGF